MKKNKTATKLLCAFLALGATGITAYATNTAPAPSAALQAPAQAQAKETANGSPDSTVNAQGTGDEDTEDAAKQAELAAQAKITEADAVAAAQAANPGWNFAKSELDSENGTVLYELKGTDANGQKQNVYVNAADGTITQEPSDSE